MTAAVANALSHDEGIHTVTFQRIEDITARDDVMSELREAVTTNGHGHMLAEGLEEYNKRKQG